MPSSRSLDATTVVLLVLGAIVVLPLVTMDLGFGGSMGYGGMMGGGAGWWPLVGPAVLAGLLAVLGGGYLLVRRRDGEQRDEALAQLRTAYARGDLSDEEFERRRERLERSD